MTATTIEEQAQEIALHHNATAYPALVAMLRETVALYGKPGGPWNAPSDPGGWISRARELLAKIDGEVTAHVAP